MLVDLIKFDLVRSRTLQTKKKAGKDKIWSIKLYKMVDPVGPFKFLVTL